MSDQKPIVFQPEGQTGNASAVEQGTPTEQSQLTLDQVRRLAEQIAEEKSQAAFQRAQGLIDKADSRITKKVQAELKTLEQTIAMQKQLGLEVPLDKVNAMRQEIIARAYTEPEATPPTAASGGAPAQVQNQESGTDPITAAAYRIMQKAGITIEDGDPEVQMIDQSDPDLFLASVGAAVQAKKARVGKPVTPTNAGSIGSPQSLEQQYRAELMKAAGKPNAVAALKIKYRQMGLDVW